MIIESVQFSMNQVWAYNAILDMSGNAVRCGLIYKLLIYNVQFIGLFRASSHRLEICETSFTYSSSVMVAGAIGSIFLIFAIRMLLCNHSCCNSARKDTLFFRDVQEKSLFWAFFV